VLPRRAHPRGAAARSSVSRLLVISQLTGAVAVLLAAVVVGGPAPRADQLGHAAAAGVCCVLGLGLLYVALAQGRVGGVLPLATAGAVIPVAIGIAVRRDAPGLVAAAGLGLALVGAPMAAWEPRRHRRTARLATAYGVGLAAGVVNGLWSVAAGTAPPDRPFGFVAVMHAVSAALACGFVAARERRGTRTRPASPLTPASSAASVALAITVGLTDAAAELSYVSAATSGQLSVVAALAPLSPAVGVVLAAGLLHENLDRVQLTGAGCAVLGGVLLCW